MTTNQAPSSSLEANNLLLEYAEELRRLANVLLREVRHGNSLPSLSSLVAMKPLHSMLFEQIASRIGDTDNENDNPPDENSTEKSTIDEKSLHPGYL